MTETNGSPPRRPKSNQHSTSRAAICREVLVDEMTDDGKYDIDRVLLLARKKFEQIPEDLRIGMITIQRSDIHREVHDIKRRQSKLDKFNKLKQQRQPQDNKPEVVANPTAEDVKQRLDELSGRGASEEKFSMRELQITAKFLSDIGGDPVRALSLITGFTSLMKDIK